MKNRFFKNPGNLKIGPISFSFAIFVFQLRVAAVSELFELEG
jgi:hypothetical protein